MGFHFVSSLSLCRVVLGWLFPKVPVVNVVSANKGKKHIKLKKFEQGRPFWMVFTQSFRTRNILETLLVVLLADARCHYTYNQ